MGNLTTCAEENPLRNRNRNRFRGSCRREDFEAILALCDKAIRLE